jgi:hypothetical protein
LFKYLFFYLTLLNGSIILKGIFKLTRFPDWIFDLRSCFKFVAVPITDISNRSQIVNMPSISYRNCHGGGSAKLVEMLFIKISSELNRMNMVESLAYRFAADTGKTMVMGIFITLRYHYAPLSLRSAIITLRYHYAPLSLRSAIITLPENS